MRRRESGPSPEAAHDLKVVEAALRGRPVGADDAELARLVTELRGLTPSPRGEFTAALDRGVDELRAEGKPAARAEPAGSGEGVGASDEGDGPLSRLRARLAAGPRPPALAGAAAAALVAVVVSASVIGSVGSDPAGPMEGDDQALVEPSVPEAATAPPPIGEDRPRVGRAERVQERSASLRLSTEPGDLGRVSDEVIGATDRHDGFVESSSVATGEGSAQRATFALRVPAAELPALLAELSELAQVLSRNEGTLDITAPFVSAEERFRDARTAVDALRERLGEAASAEQIEALRAELRRARAELAAARSQLRSVKQRANLSRVDVVLLGQGEPGWSIGDAVDDAGGVLSAIGGALLVGAAALVPLALLAGLLWAGSARWRRRRRESGLD